MTRSHELRPASRPTMYFIGVTTSHSTINRVFPLWANRLQLGDCELRGVDFALHDEPARYRAVVDFIKRDPLSLGALVTSHKVDVFAACAGQFDEIDPLTRSLAEISSIFKRGGRLRGRTVDPCAGGAALNAFLRPEHWRGGAEALILGAGGAGTALAWHLATSGSAARRPSRIHIVDRRADRLAHVARLHATWPQAAPLDGHQAESPRHAAGLLGRLRPGSLVINATGMGKDTPGSPLPDDAEFPAGGYVWELNYRGELLFLQQARGRQAARNLHIEDGWRYFLHGWISVMADVFDREIPTEGPLFDELGRLAAGVR